MPSWGELSTACNASKALGRGRSSCPSRRSGVHGGDQRDPMSSDLDLDELQLPGTIELAEIEAAVGGSAAAQVSEIPVEEQHSEEVLVNPAVSEYSAIRREQTLVLAYATYLEKRGSTVTRLRIHPPGEAKPLLSDVYDATRNNLVEAKGTGTRESVRMGIGQLADYGRFAPPGAARAVLLPDRPRADLEELLSSQGIACVWVSETGFSDNAGGRFSQA
jgi:hypothetical protein